MSIWQGLMREAQPYIVRGAVQFLRESVSSYLRDPKPLAQAQALGAHDDSGGCPYCAMRTELWCAIGAAVDANATQDATAREVYEQKLVMYLERAYQCGDTLEVVVDPEGAAILADIATLSATRAPDYSAQIRQLNDLKNRCVAKAIQRNSPPPAQPSVREVAALPAPSAREVEPRTGADR